MPAPEQIGRYRVERRLGAGAFGVVWLAHDDRLQAPVAIKVMAENWAYRMDIRERFLTEARLLRKASSGGVVQVYDIGELADERPYFVMEYADLGTVEDLASAGPLDVPGALRIGERAARGVAALFEAGVVHRDIKPSNVLLASGGAASPGAAAGRERVLVADLGLAKNVAQASGLTVVAGSAGYMAPEQAEPFEGIDGRADVYSLGAVLYRLLAGMPPAQPGKVLPLDEALPGLPEDVVRAVQHAMEPDREDRWPSAAAFADCLESLLAVHADGSAPDAGARGPGRGGAAGLSGLSGGPGSAAGPPGASGADRPPSSAGSVGSFGLFGAVAPSTATEVLPGRAREDASTETGEAGGPQGASPAPGRGAGETPSGGPGTDTRQGSGASRSSGGGRSPTPALARPPGQGHSSGPSWAAAPEGYSGPGWAAAPEGRSGAEEHRAAGLTAFPSPTPSPVPSPDPAGPDARRSRRWSGTRLRVTTGAAAALVLLGSGVAVTALRDAGDGGSGGKGGAVARGETVRVTDASRRVSVDVPTPWARQKMDDGWNPASLGLPAAHRPGLTVAQDVRRWADLTAPVSGVFVGIGEEPSDGDAPATASPESATAPSGDDSGSRAKKGLAHAAGALDHKGCTYNGSRSFRDDTWRGRVRTWSSCDTPGHSLEEIGLVPVDGDRPEVYAQIRCDKDCGDRTDHLLRSLRVTRR